MIFVEVHTIEFGFQDVVLTVHLSLVVEMDSATTSLLTEEEDVLTQAKSMAKDILSMGHNERFNFITFDDFRIQWHMVLLTEQWMRLNLIVGGGCLLIKTNLALLLFVGYLFF